MNRSRHFTIAASAASVIAVGAVLTAGAPASASPAKALACHASMSNNRPADYTTTDVRVRTADRAGVTTIAHYRTVNRKYHRTASASGHATVPYYISGATAGFKVVVDVYVHKGGRSGKCSTSFIPHR